jgi:hypothetical protein
VAGSGISGPWGRNTTATGSPIPLPRLGASNPGATLIIPPPKMLNGCHIAHTMGKRTSKKHPKWLWKGTRGARIASRTGGPLLVGLDLSLVGDPPPSLAAPAPTAHLVEKGESQRTNPHTFCALPPPAPPPPPETAVRRMGIKVGGSPRGMVCCATSNQACPVHRPPFPPGDPLPRLHVLSPPPNDDSNDVHTTVRQGWGTERGGRGVQRGACWRGAYQGGSVDSRDRHPVRPAPLSPRCDTKAKDHGMKMSSSTRGILSTLQKSRCKYG